MRLRTVLGLEIALVAVGAFMLWVVIGTYWVDDAFAALAVVAIVLSAFAMARRSWARVTLFAAALCAAVVLLTARDTADDPSDLPDVVYFLFGVGLLAFASLSLVITLSGHAQSQRKPVRDSVD